jgi:hypothetical protein
VSEQPESPTAGEDPAVGAVPPSPIAGPATDWSSSGSDAGALGAPADRPEVAVGAAFAGGFILALVLKRLAR